MVGVHLQPYSEVVGGRGGSEIRLVGGEVRGGVEAGRVARFQHRACVAGGAALAPGPQEA